MSMIQRIQTLYLLLVVALGITLVFVPAANLVVSQDTVVRTLDLGAKGLVETTETSATLAPLTLNGWWGLTVATVLIPVLALVDIFLFRKRLVQARLNIFSVCLCLGWYGVLAIMIWFAKMNIGAEWYVSPWACIPLVCMVLTLMATRRILKDEALVRAADRIR